MRNLLKRKEVKQLLQLLAIALLFFFIYYLVKYTKFYLRVHTARPYTTKEFKPSPLADEDSNTVTWLIHMYPPIHNAGAEWMAHAMNNSLVALSYKVNVVLNEAPLSDFERIHIIDKHNRNKVDSAILHSSVLISHLDMEAEAVQTACIAKRPMVLVMHNNYRKHFLQEFIRVLPKNLYLIHNSYWLKEYYSQFNIPSIVVYPPVYWKEYNVETTREYVTLINLNSNKGGDILYKIAKAMPDVQFMGVKGGYDGQIVKKGLPNLTYVENTPYIQTMYAKTDILLVPSKEESWGRVAVEAMSSGIPVIAHPTPGLLESCGSAGIFCDRNDTAAWVREIRKLKEDAEWRRSKSEKCLERAQELDPKKQLDEMAKWLSTLKWRE
jgi:glycosyltransferase involved in cell wall biosynthesis